MTTVGVIGAGQLGQMLGFAGEALGLEFVFLDPAASPPAAAVGRVIRRGFDDREGLEELASVADVITYEFENVPVAAATEISASVPVYPPPIALEKAQDRLVEKTLFVDLGIPVPGFVPVDGPGDVAAVAEQLGFPVVLKTRRLGYDGKGQVVARNAEEAAAGVAALGGGDLIAEAWVPFDREVSVIGARSVSGEIATWPLSENVHEGGILRESRAPARDDDHLADKANDYLERLLDHLGYVGVLALELFVCGDELLANEFAPRVHNSGHWTIEGSKTSQFENHLRAILDMPLGDTGMRGFAGMLNLIGEIPANRRVLEEPPAHLHDYGKSARPGRKLGHVTVVSGDPAGRDRALEALAKYLKK